MKSADVIDIYSALDRQGINIWIDGGWGVDALLNKQSRPHKDLDIVLEERHLVRLEQFFVSRGYYRTKRELERPFNFVLADRGGKEIDVHVISLDENGNGIYGPPENGLAYPADSLTGTGMISGCAVRCISPQWMVKFHSGYELTEKDYQDVLSICEKYDIALPDEYSQFKDRS
jgi:lincosamide nucleotidyltransferase A/C/D/E